MFLACQRWQRLHCIIGVVGWISAPKFTWPRKQSEHMLEAFAWQGMPLYVVVRACLVFGISQYFTHTHRAMATGAPPNKTHQSGQRKVAEVCVGVKARPLSLSPPASSVLDWDAAPAAGPAAAASESAMLVVGRASCRLIEMWCVNSVVVWTDMDTRAASMGARTDVGVSECSLIW